MIHTRTLTILAAGFVLAHAIPLLPAAPLWGVDFLNHLPVSPWLLVAPWLLLLLPAVQRGLSPAISGPLPVRMWSSRTGVPIVALLGSAAVWTLVTAMPTPVHLLGDGAVHLQILTRAAAGETPSHVNAWLTYWLLGAAARLASDLPVERVARLASQVAGVGYWLVAVFAARSLGSRPGQRAVLLAFLVTPGFVLVFCEYVETYALLFVAMIAYLWAGAEWARERVSWPVPAALLGLLVALHPLNLAFVPAWLFFSDRRTGAFPGIAGGPRAAHMAGRPHTADITRAPRASDTSRISRIAHIAGIAGIAGFARFALVALSPLAVAAVLLAATGFPIGEYLGSKQGSPLLPFSSDPGFREAYRAISWRHALDVANQYVLVAPAALLAVAALGRRLAPKNAGKNPDSAFLLGSAALPVLLTLVLNPEIGAFRDWDLMSIGAVPLTFAVGLAFTRAIDDPRILARGAVLICGLAALHTGGWISVNASTSASERRFPWLLEHAALSKHGEAYGWETWSEHLRRTGRTRDALTATESALRADPGNHRYWNQAGMLLFDLGEPADALSRFSEAKRLDPTYARTWANEGIAHFRLGQWEPAREALLHALELDPGLHVARFTAGRATLELGRPAEAAVLLREHVARNPGDAEGFFVLGNAYTQLEDLLRAIECYSQMATLSPADHRAFYNLGACQYNRGNVEAAHRSFERVLELSPRSEEANIIRTRLGTPRD